MLIFNRGKALKRIEEGLKWGGAGAAELNGQGAAPRGVFVEIPALKDLDQADRFIKAVAIEAGHVLGNARPGWVHLRGAGVCDLPADRMRAVVQAVCPDMKGFGLDLNPAHLEPGEIAGYRSIGVDRFNFRVDGPFANMDEPVRRARALGAFVAVEVCFGGELAGRAFLQAAEKAVASVPSQIALSDERGRGSFGAEFLERAGELFAAAGYRRVSMWLWCQNGHSFDGFGMMLSGASVQLGPCAVNCCPELTQNPCLARWLETRLNSSFEAYRAQGRPEQWLGLASGLYHLSLRREELDCKMHRHASALHRMGVVDKLGRPANGWPMEFCHRTVRAARLLLLGGQEAPEPQAEALEAVRKRS